MSCDLADESDTDCADVNFGSAFIDDCGSCVGGTTQLENNFRINECGKCFGEEIDTNGDGFIRKEDNEGCFDCGIEGTINYNENADQNLATWSGVDGSCECTNCGSELDENNNGWIDGCIENQETNCIFDLCEEYLINNDDFLCSSRGSSPYQIGEQLSCEDQEEVFTPCYPECDNTFSFSDFEGRVFWLMYEEDW